MQYWLCQSSYTVFLSFTVCQKCKNTITESHPKLLNSVHYSFLNSYLLNFCYVELFLFIRAVYDQDSSVNFSPRAKLAYSTLNVYCSYPNALQEWTILHKYRTKHIQRNSVLYINWSSCGIKRFRSRAMILINLNVWMHQILEQCAIYGAT